MAVGMRACNWQLAVALALCAMGPIVRSQDPQPAAAKATPLIPAENHPWARFPVGSWTLSRTTNESYDARGVATTSIEEIKTILKSASAANYTVTIERSVNIGGRRFPVQTQEQTVGLSGERDAEKVESVQTLGESELVLNGRKIPCEVRQAVVNGEGPKRTTVKVFFSPDVKPHMLRREWVVAHSREAPPSTIVEEVVSVGLPYAVAGEMRTAAFRHSQQKQGAQTKESIEVICDGVPGGVAAQWSMDMDAEGKLIRRTTQELVEFHVPQPTTTVPGRPRMMDRKRARRADDKPGPRREP